MSTGEVVVACFGIVCITVLLVLVLIVVAYRTMEKK